MAEQLVCIFAKAPIPGQTKSRLAATIGELPAAALSKALLMDIVDICQLYQHADLKLFHPPDHSKEDFNGILKGDIIYSVQTGNDLGQRMNNCFMQMHQQYERVIIIGSDCITCSDELLNQAFEALHSNDLVCQPADDGGYVLIGASTNVEPVFQDIDWGSHSVMENTRFKAKKNNLRFYELATSFDIDIEADIQKLKSFIQNNNRPHCKQWLIDFFSA